MKKGWEPIAGKKIAAVYTDGDTLGVTLESGEHYEAQVDSDCCSETWLADIIGVDFLTGGTVAEVEDIPLPENLPALVLDETRTRQDVDSFYGLSIRTDKGEAVLAYRNSSNGYYGGSVGELKERGPFQGKPLTADYSA